MSGATTAIALGVVAAGTVYSAVEAKKANKEAKAEAAKQEAAQAELDAENDILLNEQSAIQDSSEKVASADATRNSVRQARLLSKNSSTLMSSGDTGTAKTKLGA